MRQRLFSPCPFCLTQSPGIPEALWPRGRWERTDCSGGRSRNSSGGSSFYLGQGCARARCTTKAPEGTCLLLRQLFIGFWQPLHRILLLSDKLMKWTSSPGWRLLYMHPFPRWFFFPLFSERLIPFPQPGRLLHQVWLRSPSSFPSLIFLSSFFLKASYPSLNLEGSCIRFDYTNHLPLIVIMTPDQSAYVFWCLLHVILKCWN